MNHGEQQTHRTRVLQLEALLKEHEKESRMTLQNAYLELSEKIGQERTHRLKLAEEQRSYVDGADRTIRHHIESLDARLLLQETAFTHFSRPRSFWARLGWLFTGR